MPFGNMMAEFSTSGGKNTSLLGENYIFTLNPYFLYIYPLSDECIVAKEEFLSMKVNQLSKTIKFFWVAVNAPFNLVSRIHK